MEVFKGLALQTTKKEGNKLVLIHIKPHNAKQTIKILPHDSSVMTRELLNWIQQRVDNTSQASSRNPFCNNTFLGIEFKQQGNCTVCWHFPECVFVWVCWKQMLCSLLPDYRRRLCSYTERSSEKSTYLCLVSRFLTATGKRGVDKGGREREGGGW